MNDQTTRADPRADLIATVRVHPLDHETDPDARRYLLTDSDRDRPAGSAKPWTQITGNERDDRLPPDLPHDGVLGWPRQSLVDLAFVMGHTDIVEIKPDQQKEIEP